MDVDVDADVLDALVPTMVLQPIVENAVTHGVTTAAAGGRVRFARGARTTRCSDRHRHRSRVRGARRPHGRGLGLANIAGPPRAALWCGTHHDDRSGRERRRAGASTLPLHRAAGQERMTCRAHSASSIVDDEPLAREGVRLLLARLPDVTVVGEAGDGPRAVAAVRRLRPDVVLLDVQMPRADGFEVVEALAAEHSAARRLRDRATTRTRCGPSTSTPSTTC